MAGSLAAYALVGGLLLVGCMRTDLRKEFFFDEAWRADIIRSSNPFAAMKTINTPIPVLWPLVLRAATVVGFDGFASLRLKSVVLSTGFPAFTGLIAQLAWLRRSGARRRDAVGAGLAGVLGAVAMGDAVGVATYFNDYLAQAALVAMVVAAWLLVDAGLLRPRWLTAALILLGFGTLGGLMVFPGFVLMTLGRGPAVAHRRPILIGVAGGGLVAAVLYLALYRHQVDRGLVSFWQAELLRDGTKSLTGMVPYTLQSVSRMVRSPFEPLGGSVALGLVVIVLAVAGLVATRRNNGWLWRLAVPAWVAAAFASIAASWPMTVVRVNVPFVWLWAFASVCGAAALLSRVPGGLAAGVLVVGLGVLAVHHVVDAVPPGYEPFARGLNRDLDVVRASQADEVAVIGYHFMTRPYLHDGLINGDDRAGRYRIVAETEADPDALYDGGVADRVADLELPSGSEVWCVIPFEVGPVDAERACQLDPSVYEPVFDQNLERSLIKGFRVP